MSSRLPLKKGQIFLLASIGLAIVSALMLKNMAPSSKAPKEKLAKPAAIETATIPVATNPLTPGAVLTFNDFKMVKWPKAYLPQGSILSDKDDVAGRIVVSELLPGEPIYREKLARENAMGGMPTLIPKGMRAITVHVTEVKGVAGFIRPGNKVDVLGTFDVPAPESDDGKTKGEDTQVTRTILQNVSVMAIAQRMVDEIPKEIDTPEGLKDAPTATAEKVSDKVTKKKEKTEEELKKERREREKERAKNEDWAKTVSSVTLAMTPDQAEKLALAEEMGSIRLVLRPEDDLTVNHLGGANSKQLMTGASAGNWPKPPSPPGSFSAQASVTGSVSRRKGVEVIQGIDKSMVNFN